MQEEQILQLMQECLTKRTDTQDIPGLVSFRSDFL
jgi:hypothetical protein